MYQDTDFGKDVHAGVVAQIEAMGMKLAAETAHRPTDTDFNAAVARQHDAGCDLICMGTIVKDTTIILQTARKMGWNVDFCGQFASYSTAVAEAPGEPAEGFYSMAPALYAYPDDPQPAVQEVGMRIPAEVRDRHQLSGRGGLVGCHLHDHVLENAGRDLTLDSFIAAMESMNEWHDIFGGSAVDHDRNQPSCIEPVLPVCCEEQAVGSGRIGTVELYLSIQDNAVRLATGCFGEADTISSRRGRRVEWRSSIV